MNQVIQGLGLLVSLEDFLRTRQESLIPIAKGSGKHGWGGLLKFGPDGQEDPAFRLSIRGLEIQHATLLERPDGKILVGGRFGSIGGRSTGPLVLLHPSGALDTAFRNLYEPLTPEQRIGKAINEIHSLPGGNIGISGNSREYLGVPWENFMVLDSAGVPKPEVLQNLAKAGPAARIPYAS